MVAGGGGLRHRQAQGSRVVGFIGFGYGIGRVGHEHYVIVAGRGIGRYRGRERAVGCQVQAQGTTRAGAQQHVVGAQHLVGRKIEAHRGSTGRARSLVGYHGRQANVVAGGYGRGGSANLGQQQVGLGRAYAADGGRETGGIVKGVAAEHYGESSGHVGRREGQGQRGTRVVT